jgi:hypothetical protein
MCNLLHHCLHIDPISQHKLSNPLVSMEQTSSLEHKVNSYVSMKIVEYF